MPTPRPPLARRRAAAGLGATFALALGAAALPVGGPAVATDTAAGISQVKLSYPTADPSSSIAVSWRDGATAGDGVLQIVPTGADFAGCPGSGCRVVSATRELVGSADGPPYAYYQAETTSLRPGTTFRYRVTDGGTASPAATFTTTKRGSARLRAAFVGEVHIGDQPQPGWPAPALAPTLDRIKASGARFVVSTGDNVDTGALEAEWERFFGSAPSAFASVPYLSAVGNHETYGGFGKGVPSGQFFAGFPQPANGDGSGRYYSFTANGVHVAVVEANPETPRPSFRREMSWLRADLKRAATRSRFQVVITHSPPFHSKTSRVRPVYENPEFRNRLVPLMDRYGVEMVVSGHDKHYVRSYPLVGRRQPGAVPVVRPRLVRPGLGTTYMELTSTGQNYPDFLRQRWMRKAVPVTAAYLQLDFRSSRIVARAIGPDGTVIDRFAVPRVR